MDLEQFLQRIDYHGSREPTLETLAALQRQFLYRVPFENLDIHLDRPITLSPDNFYEKIVENGRGGFCYECNGLFNALLTELGFETALHGATMLLDSSWPLELGHMVLSVQLDRRYLVDVGNGQSCREPLCIDGDDGAASEGLEYRIHIGADGPVLYYRGRDTEWRPRFHFTTEPRRLEDFTEACRIQQTSPRSRFTRHRLASLATPDGRITLLDGELTTVNGDHHELVQMRSADAYGRALADHFGIELPLEDVETLYKGIFAD